MPAAAAAAVDPRDGFRAELARRVQRCLRGHRSTGKADWRMTAKIVVGLAAYAFTYGLLLVPGVAAPWFAVVFAAHGLAAFFIMVNIGHDANHGAISSRRWVNDLLSYTMELCGLNSRLWRLAHHHRHHGMVNVGVSDEALRARGLLRLSPNQPRPAFGRWQHVYAWFVYLLTSLDYLWIRDWEYQWELRRTVGCAEWWRGLAEVTLGKALYLGAMLLLPWWIGGHPPGVVFGAFILAHLLLGFLVLLLFQTTHVIEGNRFPAGFEEAGHPVARILDTTVDVAVDSRFLALVAGGLHAHAIHHFFPGICHTYYPELSHVLEQTAADCEIRYRSNRRFAAALRSHLRWLRALGRDIPDPV